MRRSIILAAVGAIVLVGGAVAVTVLAFDRPPAPLAPKQISGVPAKAEDAYKHGDFPAALAQYKGLAGAGNALAQYRVG